MTLKDKSERDQIIIRHFAKVMNGPWDFEGHLSTVQLEQLREVKWGQLNSHEQSTLLMQAMSVWKELRDHEAKYIALLKTAKVRKA